MTRGATKPIPRSIAVFGAATRLGRAVARQIRFAAPDVRLRVLTTSEAKLEGLRHEFPEAEHIVANLYDPASLDTALAGMEGIFVVTPPGLDEAVAMPNLVGAVKKAGCAVHLVRIAGFEPEAMVHRWPETARGFGLVRHVTAKRILDASGLPVTYLNVGATMIDNFLIQAPLVKAERRFVYAPRLITFMDSRDAGECAACLLLSPDERHLYQFLTVNNGQDILDMRQVTDILSDVLKVKIAYDDSREAFMDLFAPILARAHPDSYRAVFEEMMTFIEFEQTNSAFLSLNDCAERILGRKPVSVYDWFREHKEQFA